MFIGSTVHFGNVAACERLPFDYFEISLGQLVPAPADERKAFLRRLRDTGKPLYAANGLFRGEDGFFERGDAYFRDWFDRAFDLMAEVGVERVVFGSGGARRYDPTKMSYWKALNRSYELLRLAEEFANRSGVIIGWEALNRSETNVGNTVLESAWIMRTAGVSNIHGVTADLFHMDLVGDEPSDIQRAGNVVHAHFASPEGRRDIRPTDAYDYRPFFAALRAAGIDHASLEGSIEDATPQAIAFMHEVAEADPARIGLQP